MTIVPLTEMAEIVATVAAVVTAVPLEFAGRKLGLLTGLQNHAVDAFAYVAALLLVSH